MTTTNMHDDHGSSSLPAAIADNFKQQDPARRVAIRTAGFATLGGLCSAGSAALRFGNPATAALASAASTGGSAFAFFSVREYIAVPALQHYGAVGALDLPRQRDLQGVSESALAGFGAGCALSGYHFGIKPPRMLSGGVTLALVGTVGQMTYNQLDTARIRYLSRRESTSPLLSEAEKDGASERQPPLPFVQRATDALFSLTPIRKITDDEYARTLEDKIAHSRKELSGVDAELEALNARLDQLQAGTGTAGAALGAGEKRI